MNRNGWRRSDAFPCRSRWCRSGWRPPAAPSRPRPRRRIARARRCCARPRTGFRSSRIAATGFSTPHSGASPIRARSPTGSPALPAWSSTACSSVLRKPPFWRASRGFALSNQPTTQRTRMSDHKVDLFVIGAGSGGVRAARIAAGHGARVMVAEEYRVGGTCVIRGCVPKKLLVYASRFADEFEDAAGFGWTVPKPTFDWATLIANKDREIDRLEAAYVAGLERAKVRLVKSRAVLDDPHTVFLQASGERIHAAHILVATGAAPHMGPPIMGIEHVISSNQAFHLDALPRHVLVQG